MRTTIQKVMHRCSMSYQDLQVARLIAIDQVFEPGYMHPKEKQINSSRGKKSIS